MASDINPIDLYRNMAQNMRIETEEKSEEVVFDKRKRPQTEKSKTNPSSILPPNPSSILPPNPSLFYKSSRWFFDEPKQGGLRKCFLCLKQKAEVRCFSCGTFAPGGDAIFCKSCFDSHHPWYRVDHKFIQLNQDEDPEECLTRQSVGLEIDRVLFDIRSTLKETTQNRFLCDPLMDETNPDEMLRSVGRKLCESEEHVAHLQEIVRKEIRPVYTRETNDAVMRLQGVVRIMLAKRRIKKRAQEVLRKVWDEDNGLHFYFNSLTQESTWEKPGVLGDSEAPEIGSDECNVF